jgi:hypothetical protein
MITIRPWLFFTRPLVRFLTLGLLALRWIIARNFRPPEKLPLTLLLLAVIFLMALLFWSMAIAVYRRKPFGRKLSLVSAVAALPLIWPIGVSIPDQSLGSPSQFCLKTKFKALDQISPVFHLGFASIQGLSSILFSSRKVYVIVTSSGHRVELRPVSTYVYEAADSSYLQRTDNQNNTLTLRTTQLVTADASRLQIRFAVSRSADHWVALPA